MAPEQTRTGGERGRGGRGRSGGRGRGRGRGRGGSRGGSRGGGRGGGIGKQVSPTASPSPAAMAAMQDVSPAADAAQQGQGQGLGQGQRPLHAGARTTSTTRSQMTATRFADLNVAEVLKRAIAEVMGYDTATVVQERSIPVSLTGRDVLVKAKTGTGKTLVCSS